MVRRRSTFKRDLLTSIKVARAAGLVVTGIKADHAFGEFSITTAEPGKPGEQQSVNALERWRAKHKGED